jgi:hypothetical protein
MPDCQRNVKRTQGALPTKPIRNMAKHQSPSDRADAQDRD